MEIHYTVEGGGHEGKAASRKVSLHHRQILVLDIVFSLDSVITAVGMSRHLP
jgi:predicted tellurium resistance membrane protein TerC